MLDARTHTRWPIPLDDPYPTLRELRASGPLHWLPDLDTYLVVSYDEAMGVLQGPEWSSDPTKSPRLAAQLASSGTAREFVAKSLLLSDPPEHTRLRRAISGHLTPRTVEGLRSRIGAIVDAAISSHGSGEVLEVMDEIAYPVPLAVMCELLDAGVDTAEMLRQETPRITAILDPLAEPGSVEAGAMAALALILELVPLVAERKARPGGDLLSALVAGAEQSPVLEADEAIVMALLLLAAGHETTANVIGNAVICLHDHPDVARCLRAQPDLVPAAIEEVLRYEAPVQLTSRVARRDSELGDQAISAGQQVLVSLGGANRDPAAFLHPDALNLERGARGHLAFGHGTHFCAGAAFARVESHEVLRRLLRLRPPIEEREVTLERGEVSATFRRVNKLVLH
jgi:cytochrome P450